MAAIEQEDSMDYFSLFSKADRSSSSSSDLPLAKKPKLADFDRVKPPPLIPVGKFQLCPLPRAAPAAPVVAQYIRDRETDFPHLLGRDVSQRLCLLENVMRKWTVAEEIVLPNAKCHIVSMSINLNGHLVAHSYSGPHATLIDPRTKGAVTHEVAVCKPEGFQPFPGARSERYNHVLFASKREHTLYTSSSNDDNYIRIWDIRNLKQPIASLRSNYGTIVDIVHNPENGALLFAHNEGPLCWWDVELAQCQGSKCPTAKGASAVNEAEEDASPCSAQLLHLSSLKCLGILEEENIMFLGNSAGFFVIIPTLELSGLASILSNINLSQQRMEKGYFEWFKQTLPKAYRDKVLCLSDQDYLPAGWDKVSLLSSAKLCKVDGCLCLCAHVTVIAKPRVPQTSSCTSFMRPARKDLLLQLDLPALKGSAAAPCMRDMMFGNNFRASLSKLDSVHHATETLYRPLCRKCIDATTYPCPLAAVPSLNGVRVWRLQSPSKIPTSPGKVEGEGLQLRCLSEISTHHKSVVSCCISPRDLLICAADVEGKVQVLKPQL